MDHSSRHHPFSDEAEKTMIFNPAMLPEGNATTFSLPPPLITPVMSVTPANDQHLLALVEAASVVAPAAAAVNSPATDSTSAPPSDYQRCKAGLNQLSTALAVARRVDELARSLRYANDDMTSLAISSFSTSDLWKAIGYRGTPDDAKFHLRKQRLELKAAMMRAAAIAETAFGPSAQSQQQRTSSGGGSLASTVRKVSSAFRSSSAAPRTQEGGNSDPAALTTNQTQQSSVPPPAVPFLDSASRFAEIQKHGGVLVDESSEALVALQQFLSELVDGKFITEGVVETPLEFPSHPSSPLGSAGRRSSDTQPLSRANSAASDIGISPLSRARRSRSSSNISSSSSPQPTNGVGSMADNNNNAQLKIKLARQTEMQVKCKFAHDAAVRSLCLDEERRFQRVFVLEVLALVAIQQLEGEVGAAKQRLRTCEVLKHRGEVNPQRAESDEDMSRCVALIPDLRESIAQSMQQLQLFEQKYHKRFHRAMTDCVQELCGFNREVHSWNHYVDHRSRRHANAKRRTLQSLFTVLSKLESGELSLDKNPEIFIKVQLFEKLDSTITLARQAQDLLNKYKRRLAVLDRLPNGKITAEDLDRWTVELKKSSGARGGPVQQKSKRGGGSAASKNGGRSRRSSVTSAKSSGSALSNPSSALGGGSAKPSKPATSSAAGSHRRSSVMSSASGKGGSTVGDEPQKAPKRWRFKLFDEAHDDERLQQYETLIDAESDVVLGSIRAILQVLSDNMLLWKQNCVSVDGEPGPSSSGKGAAGLASHRGTLKPIITTPAATSPKDMVVELPRPIRMYYVAICSVASDVLDVFHNEISRWDDADLLLNTDDDEDDVDMPKAEADPLNRSSMSSSFGGSSVSSMGDVPSAHVPPWIEAEEQQRNAYRRTVLRLMEMKQGLQQLVDNTLLTTHTSSTASGSGGAVLKKFDPQKHKSRRASHDPTSNGDEPLFRIHNSTSPPLVHHHVRSPAASSSGGSPPSSVSALALLATIDTCPDPLPLPNALTQLEARERDLLILRPGELLIPPAPPPLWSVSGSGNAKGGFIANLLKTLQSDAQSNQLLKGALSLETHQPFWRKETSNNRVGGTAQHRAPQQHPPLTAHQHPFRPVATALHALAAGSNGARPPTAPTSAHRRPQYNNKSSGPTMLVVDADFKQRRLWSADTSLTASNRQSSPVSPTGMPEVFSWTPEGTPGPEHLPARRIDDGPRNDMCSDDGGFAPWATGGSSDGCSGRRSRPGTGGYHATLIRDAQLRLSARPITAAANAGGGLTANRWAPTKPFR